MVNDQQLVQIADFHDLWLLKLQSRGPSKPELLDARRSHKGSKRGVTNGINGKKRKSEKRRARVSVLEVLL